MRQDDVRDALLANLQDGGAEHALAFRGTWYDWSFLRMVHATISGALDAAGLGAGTPIALIAHNLPPNVAAAVSLLATGRTTCMIYGAQTPLGLAAEVRKLNAPALIAFEDDWSEPVIAAVREIGALGLSLSLNPDAPAATVAPLSNRPLTAFKPAAADIALELLSSGTTGPPKRIPLHWSAVSASIQDGKAVYAATGPDQPAPAIMIHPLGNISGLAYAITPMVFRKTVVMLEKFDLAIWLDAVKTYRPKRGALPPAAIRMVLEANVPVEDLASLSLVGTGGTALPSEVQTAFEDRYGIPIIISLGATEFGGVVANWTLDLHRSHGEAKRGSVGRARPGVELRIVDPETFDPVEPGDIGLLEAKVDRIGPDWIRTNDLANIDEDAFIFLQGRADSAINRGGFKIVPETVAAALAAHPAVSEVVVVPLDDARLGQVPAAAVEVKPDAPIPSEAELISFARDRLVAYQVPVRVLALRQFPRNVSMKPSIAEILQMFSATPSA